MPRTPEIKTTDVKCTWWNSATKNKRIKVEFVYWNVKGKLSIIVSSIVIFLNGQM